MPFLGTTPTQGFVSAVTKQTFTPNGSTTVFTLSHSVANENDLEVFVGNVRQEPGSGKAYTAAGTTLTMSEAVASGVNFYVIFKNKAQVTTTPPVNSISTDKIANDAVTGAKIENNPTIAGNLTVSGNFTSQGIDDNADATAMTIDSSERVLVGTTSAVIIGSGGIALKGADGRIDASGAGGPAALLDRRTNDGDIVGLYKAGSQIGSISVISGDNLAIASTSADHAGLMLGGHSIIPMEANAQADGTINLGSSTKRFQNLILSGGVKLGGTGTANTLDDYEEGTHTITFTNSSATPSGAGAVYTKIGDVVNYVGSFTFPSSSSSTAVNISIPFTSATNNSLGIIFTNGVTNKVLFTGGGGTNYMRIYPDNSFGQNSYANLSGVAIYFTITYKSA